jgi:uncharacterized membrane protein YozB (DUF420 family)
MELDNYPLTKAVLDAFNKVPDAHKRIGRIAARRWLLRKIPPPFPTSIDTQ